MEFYEFIKSDYNRYSGGKNLTIRGLIFYYLFNRSFKFLVWFRLAKSKSIFRRLAKLQYIRFSRKYIIHIPLSVEIGYGFYIGHGTSVIINKNVKIGNNVNVSQFTSIGSNDDKGAIIDDNVYIGPGVMIVDDVFIGHDSIIGAGSVVTKDVEPNSIYAGVPAKKININPTPNKYIKDKWNINE